MAVNVNTVYKTVLLILNKEQRGYMTPSEFNNVAAQVQLEIFNKYFDDLNQLLRSPAPQTDFNYADRVSLLDEKIAIFKKTGAPIGGTLGVFTTPNDLRELGSIAYKGIEIERLQKNEFYNINKSDLTTPSVNYPVYLYEGNQIKIYPIGINASEINNIEVNYIRKIVNPIWGFTIGTRGQYIYNPAIFLPGSPSTGSIDFELHESEQTKLITRILLYAGIIIKDPLIVQSAAQQTQLDDINSKA